MNVKFRFLLLPLLISHVALATGASEPASVVDKLHASLLEAMKKADELGYSGRYKMLEPVVGSVFDFPTISQVVMGRYWKDLTEDQRASFIATFTKLSIATYASRFDGFSNEEFHYVAQDKLKGERILIKTAIKKPDGEAVRLDYVLQSKGNHWLIVNVIANGVSDLSLKRADYTKVLKEKGYDALMAMLSDKIAQHERLGAK